MDLSDLHSDYLDICRLKCGIETKRRCVAALLDYERPRETWNIVGITRAAVDAYQANDFKPVKLNRSHKVDRVTTFRELVENPIEDVDRWWAFVVERGRCVLATATENITDRWSEVIEIPQGKGLFQGDGIQFSAKYRQTVERPWVEQMCRKASS